MEVVLIWFVFAVVVAILAGKRGRSGFLWFLFSIFLSPLIAGLLVLVLPDLSIQAQVVFAEAPRPDTHMRCPECKELVRRDALKCKHCGTKLSPQ